MKKLIIAATLALAACGTTSTGTGTVVNSVSSQVVVSANDLYTAGSRAGADLVKLGLLDKDLFKARDLTAYNALLQVRMGKATVDQLQIAVTAITAKQ